MRWLLLVPAVVFVCLAVSIPRSQERHLGHERAMLRNNRTHLATIGYYLRDYKKTHGAHPTNDQGLLTVKPLIEAMIDDDKYDPMLRNCFPFKCGITSCFGDPFIYENRAPYYDIFSSSGADKDPDGMYSLKVDENIYVWSIGAQQAYNKYNAERTSIAVITTVCYILGALFLAGYIATTIRTVNNNPTRDKKALRAAGLFLLDAVILAAAGAIALFYQPARESCYVPGYRNTPSAKLTQDYLSLMEKYHKGGVISDTAYKKIKENAWNYEPLKDSDDEKDGE